MSLAAMSISTKFWCERHCDRRVSVVFSSSGISNSYAKFITCDKVIESRFAIGSTECVMRQVANIVRASNDTLLSSTESNCFHSEHNLLRKTNEQRARANLDIITGLPSTRKEKSQQSSRFGAVAMAVVEMEAIAKQLSLVDTWRL